MLPKDDIYTPPMNIKVKDYRSFGRKPIVGFHIIKSLEPFRCDPTLPSLTFIQNESNTLKLIFSVQPIDSKLFSIQLKIIFRIHRIYSIQ